MSHVCMDGLCVHLSTGLQTCELTDKFGLPKKLSTLAGNSKIEAL